MFYNDKKFVGNKLKQARLSNNLSQVELAEKINLSEKHISNIERGQNFPSLDTFFKMCEVLNLSLNDFGLAVNSKENKTKIAVLNKIYSATDNELNSYNEILNTLDKILKENC